MSEALEWIAFNAGQKLAHGAPREVAAAVKRCVDADASAAVLVFDARTSATVELDLRGSLSEVLARLPAAAPAPATNDADQAPAERGVGRPKLGVVAREVTLLPRHWDYLASQPGGASVVLRKLVEGALRAGKDADAARRGQEAAYRFISVVAGDRPGFEEASRALFAADLEKFAACCASWPTDVAAHALALARASLPGAA